MTEQSKIYKYNAKRPSLLERADMAFGLDKLGAAKVPAKIPLPKKRIVPAPAQPSSTPAKRKNSTAAEIDTAQKTVQPVFADSDVQPVALSGSNQKINREHLRDAGLIVPEDTVTGLLEEFRIVKRDLIADARASKHMKSRRVLVCSPHQGEGKTYCATNLAIALAAERNVEVLLVDVDVLRPSVANRLGIKAGKGFMDALADPSLNPERLAIKTDIGGLYVLPAGSTGSHDAEILASDRTGQVLDRLTQGAPNRFLIFDTPPALAASAAAELASHVGQTILVVRADETSQAALEDARQLLSASPNIKLLLNAAQFSPSGRRFGDYYEKGD